MTIFTNILIILSFIIGMLSFGIPIGLGFLFIKF